MAHENVFVYKNRRKLFVGTDVSVFHTQHVGQSRPMESIDGLHWRAGKQGHVHAMQAQMWLNELFAGVQCLDENS